MDYTDYYLEESKRLSELEQLEKAERGITTSGGTAGTSSLMGSAGSSGYTNPDVTYDMKNGTLLKYYKGKLCG